MNQSQVTRERRAGGQAGRPARRRLRWTRRGVASVLAMMFVVLFGSLAVAMAIVSKGNLRTAQTHLHVLRAMGAADTGMEIAKARLLEATKRFIMDRGQVDADLGPKLWNGTWSISDGQSRVLPTRAGYAEPSAPAGIAQALANAFNADANIVSVAGISDDPEIHEAPATADTSVYAATGWLTCPAVAIDADAGVSTNHPAAYQVTYAPLANGTDIRIIVTGYSSIGSLGGTDYQYGGGASRDSYRPLTRVIQQDFRITKQHEHAVLSPSRIMIGKNVHVTGDLGGRYTDVAQNDGHPIVMRSDFQHVNATLDAKLNAFYAAVAASDGDNDNRLRGSHPTEGAAIPSSSTDYDGDGQPDNAFADATGDGYVDEFDIFLNHYDRNHDGKVVLSSRLTAGTPAEGLTVEFDDDEDLALLLDSNNPDRNRNGVYGFLDANRNGTWDQGETILDYDARTATYADRVLGWRDGVIDRKDAYTKMNGKIVLSATQGAWTAAQGDYHQFIQGGILPELGDAPLHFGAGSDELPEITASSFSANTALYNAADGAAFATQVASQLGVAATDLPTYVESSTNPAEARYFRADLDDATVYSMTGRHLYERMPFNAPVQAYSDWYIRGRYENMVFHDVQIPEGTNALFINCTFVGVTYVRTCTENAHENWTLYGKMEWNASQNRPIAVTTPLDKSDFARYYTGNPVDGPANYDEFPDPPVIHGVTRTGAARNTKLYSNNIRFHDCLFVGSVVSDTPEEYTHVRNKLQFTGSTRFATQHPDRPDDPDLNPSAADLVQIEKSSMMAPNYSVDIGQFNSPTDSFVPAEGETAPTPQNVKLSGTIVAGVLDVRGNSEIDGSLLLTFMPVAGEGPLQHNGEAVGNPAGFNCTLGYFGPDDGDGESLDPNTLPVVDGRRVVGWDTDGDGIADVPHDQARPSGSAAVPFYGYGRIELKWNPNLPMPDGIMLPVNVVSISTTYREGRH
ncbi:MAG: hypothetical protein AB7G11_07885 [Phycisphaerales bacterium]